MAGGRGNKKKYPVLYWFYRNNRVSPSSSRTFRKQYYSSFITRQCNYWEQLLPVHLSCRMCNQFTLHHQFGIDTWRSKFEQQTDSILSACGSHGQRVTRILIRSTWMNRVMQNTCTKHGKDIKTQCIGSTSILLLREKIEHSIRRDRNAIILHETLPSYCIPKVVRMETGEVIYEQVYMSPRPPPKISLRHDWKRDLGSEHAQRPEVGQQSSNVGDSNQPIPNPSRERSGQTRCQPWHDSTVQDGSKQVPFSGDRCQFFSRRNCFFGEIGPHSVVETSVIQTRLSEDSKDTSVRELVHERLRRLVETNTENVRHSSVKQDLVMKAKHSIIGDKTLSMKERGDPLLTMTIQGSGQTMPSWGEHWLPRLQDSHRLQCKACAEYSYVRECRHSVYWEPPKCGHALADKIYDKIEA